MPCALACHVPSRDNWTYTQQPDGYYAEIGPGYTRQDITTIADLRRRVSKSAYPV